MKLFSHYLKDRCLFIVIYAFSLLTCYVVFKLYNLELEAFTYAFMILCVLLVVCFFWDYTKLDIENPIIRINTAFKGCSSLEKISVLPRIYHN